MKNTSRKRGLFSFLTRTRKKFSPIKWSPPKDGRGNEIEFGKQPPLLFKDSRPLLNLGPQPITNSELTNDPRIAAFAAKIRQQKEKTHFRGDTRTRDAHYRQPFNDFGEGKKSKRRRPTKRRPTKRRKSKKRKSKKY